MTAANRDRDIEDLRRRLEEAEAVIEALRDGSADAMVASAGLVGFAGSERPYRAFFESMNEGGLTLDESGRILHCNPRFAAMVGVSVGEIRNRRFLDFLVTPDLEQVTGLCEHHHRGTVEAGLMNATRQPQPVLLSMTRLDADGRCFICVVVTDLREQRAAALATIQDSETKYRLLAENATDWIFWVDADGRYRYVSPASLQLSGYAPEEFVVDPGLMLNIIHPEDRASYLAHLVSNHDRPDAIELQYRIIRRNGELRWIGHHCRPMHDDAGQYIGRRGNNQDITERKRANEELEAYRHHLERIVEQRTQELTKRSQELADLYHNAPCGYHSLGPDGTIIQANDTELRLLGYAREEYVGHPVSEFLTTESKSLFKQQLPVFSEQGMVRDLELEFIRKDGTTLSCLVSSDLMRDGNGKFAYSRSTLADNRERKAAEEAISRARDAAEAANRAKSSFLANMSHEIRTPMNAIIGMTHILRREVRDTSQIEKLGKIATAADHLLGIINDILDISKIEADKLVLEQANFDLEAVLVRICSMVSDRVHDKQLELVLDVEPGLGVVRGDATRLGQALLNYLVNAVKFTEKGTITLRARLVESASARICVRFEIQDTGIGIPPEALGRLFNSFEQADGSTTRKYGGTGLGLAITRRLAKLMDGEAGVESIVGQGSTFWLTACLGRVIDESDCHHVPALRGTRALVVDDNPVTRLVHSQLLARIGFECDAVGSGEDAVDAIAAADATGRPYALTLIDLMMGGMDGIQTLTTLHGKDLKHRPVSWLVTGSGDSTTMGEARRAGFDEVLLKPLSAAVLQEKIVKHSPAILREDNGSTPVAETRPSGTSAEESLRLNHGSSRLLLVEDEPINREVTLMILGGIGWQVDVAEDGQEAVDRIRANHYDLVLMDMQMPVLDGLDATRIIRQMPARQTLPILAMTANAFSEDRDACFNAGMNDFITKPVVPDRLYEILLKWLSRSVPTLPG